MNAQLHAAIAARTEAAARVETAAAALARGNDAAAAAQAEVARLDAEEREWIARDARRRVERAQADAGPAPSLVPTDKAFLNRRKAEVTLAAELQAVASLEAAVGDAHEALAAAEQAVIDTVDAVLAAEAAKAAQSILRLRDEMVAHARRRLPNPLQIPLNQLSALPPSVQQAMALVEKLLPDDFNKPLHELGGPPAGMFRAFDDTYEQRRAALIRGELAAAGEAEASEQQESAA